MAAQQAAAAIASNDPSSDEEEVKVSKRVKKTADSADVADTTNATKRGRGRKAASVSQTDDNDDSGKNDTSSSAPTIGTKRGRGAKATADSGSDSNSNNTTASSGTGNDSNSNTAAAAPAKGRGRGKAAAASAPDPAATSNSNDATATDAVSSSTSSNSNATADAPKMKKLIAVAGRAPVDEWVDNPREWMVHKDYDAMLNQTNIDRNNNKFYLLQVLKHVSSPLYMTWFRWGRVGVTGQMKAAYKGPSEQSAIDTFERKFQDKAEVRWADRYTASYRPGVYQFIERDYSDDNKKGGSSGDGEEKKEIIKLDDSKLDPRLQKLVSMISDQSMMRQQMIEIGYDANKLPLGKLSKRTIKMGYDVLTRIAEELKKPVPSRQVLVSLSNEFYTIIPHEFGFSTPPIIGNDVMLKQKVSMVEALGEIEVATHLMEESKEIDTEHPIDKTYKKLKCKLTPIDKDSDTWKMIETYVTNTQAATHARKPKVVDIFEIDREGETERFCNGGFDKFSERYLLWHGSRLTNFVGIPSQGLRIAPPEAPVTGYMFGKGVYFADMVSKSANYCTTNNEMEGCILLCEVAIGKPRELYQSDYYASNLPNGYHSTKGVGGTHPDPSKTITLDDGVKVPLGKGIKFNPPPGKHLSLLYNEYIVYDVAQIRMRYIIRFKSTV